MMLEVNKSVSLYLIFPVTTATAERLFSSLLRIKSFLHSTMMYCRLSNITLASLLNTLDLTTVAKEFLSVVHVEIITLEILQNNHIMYT